ncbi:DNA polymerase eta-like [Polypterus senegalus]
MASCHFRSPALTLLQLSASKFTERPTSLASGITSFLKSEVMPTPCATDNNLIPSASSPKKANSVKKPLTGIELFFKRASEKQEDETLGCPLYPNNTKLCSSEGSESSFLKHSQVKQDTGDFLFFNNRRTNSSSMVMENATGTLELTSQKTYRCGSESKQEEDSGSSDKQILNGSKSTIASKDVAVSCENKDKEAAVPNSIAVEDLVECEKCGKDILVWEMPEHADYHFAVELQSSFSPPSARPHSEQPQATNVPSRGKSKNKGSPGPSPKRSKPHIGNQTLDFFFKKKSVTSGLQDGTE